jgi:hypothetical protein
VAISWTFNGNPEPVVLVFDATTHEFLGDNWGFTVVDIVDRPGRRP